MMESKKNLLMYIMEIVENKSAFFEGEDGL
jgi:hypothetical protein